MNGEAKNRIKNVKEKREQNVTENTSIARNSLSLSLSVPLCVLLLQPLFCDDLGACSNSLFPPFYQFKFPMSPIDFGKPCFCLQAWFVKIK